jgi:hypothetical protein
MPTFGWDYPIQYLAIPENERDERASLGTDNCVIDGELYFVRGCLEVAVHGQSEPFSWGAWVSLSEKNYSEFVRYVHEPKRSHVGPFFGWLSAHIWIYPDTVNLKTMVHLRDDGIRPYIELEPTNHPLAIEQRDGITEERVAEIFALVTHGKSV